jgi:hypothetical protein
VRTTGACKLFCISRQKFGQFLALVPDFASRVKFVADTRVKLNRLRDQQVEAAGERTKAMEGYEAAAVAEVLNQPNMRRCCSVVKRKWTMPTLAAAHATTLVSPRARCFASATLWALEENYCHLHPEARPLVHCLQHLPTQSRMLSSRRSIRAAEKDLQLEHAHRFNVAVGDTSAKHAYLKKRTTAI